MNFGTAHDGFTLHDLVSYDRKHNDENGEGNADGSDANNSWNCGVEGPTDDTTVLNRRRQQMRNMLLTLLLSQGVPMLTAGDEFARTQRGNNNAYCQDNELSWVLWDEIGAADEQLLAFTRELLLLRDNHIVFRRSRFFHGELIPGTDVHDVTWLTPAGEELTTDEWADPHRRTLGMMISGQAGQRFLTERGEPEPDDTFLVLLNAGHKRITWTLPDGVDTQAWRVRLSTAYPTGVPSSRRSATSRIVVGARTATVLVQYRERQPGKRFRSSRSTP